MTVLPNNRQPKNLIPVKIVATTLVLLSLILPYFGLMSHRTTPVIILITLFAFFIVERKYRQQTKSI